MSTTRTVTRKLADTYRKNKDDFGAILLGKYPAFVFRNVDKLPLGEIPVFVFHSVEPAPFEAQLKYLAENNYKTIDADTLAHILSGKVKAQPNTVVLTFDDGRGSVWATAYPLLKKYGFCAISFILPLQTIDSDHRYPHLEDVWQGRCSLTEVIERETIAPLCTWSEIEEMHQSGVIDFQSHTSFHHSVFVSHEFFDFINPSLQASFLTSTLSPVIRKAGQDTIPHTLEFGQPIYKWAATMATNTRYIEDEYLSQSCIDFVRQNGGLAFFKQDNWRKLMKAHVVQYTTDHGSAARYQSPAERFAEVREDLHRSRQVIEDRLGKPVKHLCYPWYAGSELAVRASKEAGYTSNHWGILGRRTINRPGTNPYYITRINDDYIFTLPGQQRINLPEVLYKKFSRILTNGNTI